MNVYLLLAWVNYEGHTVMGVFDSKAAAIKCAETDLDRVKSWADSLHIQQWEVNAIKPLSESSMNRARAPGTFKMVWGPWRVDK